MFAGEDEINFYESTPILEEQMMHGYQTLAPGISYLPGYLLMHDFRRDMWLAISLVDFSITHTMTRD